MKFDIPLKDGRIVHMQNDMWPLRNIIWIDAKKLLPSWANEPFCYQGADEWRKDEKYPEIERCFAQSADYPVPVPFYGIDRYDTTMNDYKIKIVDGITRTLWLMANGAASFPIYTSGGALEPIQRLIGLT